MKLNFKTSTPYTVGIEIEVQLVDKNSLALTGTSQTIIESTGGMENSIKHELMTSNLEINTKVCSSTSEAEEDLLSKFSTVAAEAEKCNTLIFCSGSHPFSKWLDQEITEDSRYIRLVEKLQIVAKRFNIFGLHVHIGVGDPEKCIYIMNRMLYYLPHLLALSANSPFWEGDNTGLKSYRTKIFESLPTAGLPFYFKDWNDYVRLVRSYMETGTIETIREIWWDVRPHPDFGTLEFRICDAPASIKEMLAIAALIQALCANFGNDFEKGLLPISIHPSVTRENKWRACRYGVEAELITEDGFRTIPATEAIKGLIESLSDISAKLGGIRHMEYIDSIIRQGDGASRQLAYWQKEKSLEQVVLSMSKELYKEISENKKGI